MTDYTDPLAAKSLLSEYRFVSQTPIIGPLLARLRSAWYQVAARWGDQSIINQQSVYNQTIAQVLAEHDQRLILADRDLTTLTRTVGELTQQVIELRHTIEELQIARTRSGQG